MERMQSISKKLDVCFKIFEVLLTIAMIGCLIGLGIIAAGVLFQLPADLIGTGYHRLDVGMLELELAQSVAPDPAVVLVQAFIALMLTLILIAAGKRCIVSVRSILSPMTQGLPFHREISVNLKKIAVYILILGIASNLIELVSHLFLITAYDLPGLMISEKITHMTIQYHADLSFLLISAVFLLLSHVFRYGEALQQLSDETL